MTTHSYTPSLITFDTVEGFCERKLTLDKEEEWDDRNLLYSLRYDLGAAVLIPGAICAKCN